LVEETGGSATAVLPTEGEPGNQSASSRSPPSSLASGEVSPSCPPDGAAVNEANTQTVFLSEQTPDGIPPGAPEPQRQSSTADAQRIARTLQAAGPVKPEPQRQSGTADERRIAQTLQAVGPLTPVGSEPPQPPREDATADEKRIAATLAAGALPIAAPSVPLTEADSHRNAPTVESGNLPAELVQRVSMLWSGKFDATATPWTSIKSNAQTIEEESRLVIQPRVISEIKAPDKTGADYELLKRLGEGGMGVVVAARQASINRIVALKKIKPAEAGNAETRQKFLSEAIVTGDLEHPNIVPIYDLGKDESGTPFYSMKYVKGTPWDRVIEEKSEQENLEIWMKVADAVAFAHSRGIIHRDLKPENIMLGGFGEVLVMDWGLALAVGTPAAKKAGMAGTPAYMAPEMAAGPMERIGFRSDVYLLGAILYEIVTGKKAHSGGNITTCLLAAARNEIQPTERSGELVEIARKAMASDPEDRYATVGDLQDAYRQYRSHAESITLSTRAEEDLQQAGTRQDYEFYARALFGFQEAYALWNGNARAKQGIEETTLAYAKRAFHNGDFDLGAKLLDAQNAAHAPLLYEIRLAQRERDARVQRLKTARRVGAGLLVTILAVVTVAFLLVNNQRNIAEAAKNDALVQKKNAEHQTEIAEENENKANKAKSEAVAQKKEADQQRERAEAQTKIAVAQTKIAKENESKANKATRKEVYGGYIARIGLAAAKIEENDFDRAQTLLEECPTDLRNWEWGRLMHLCTQGSRTVEAVDPIEALAFTPDGGQFAAGGWGGTVRIWDSASRKLLREISTGGDYVFALAFSPDGRHLAAGTNCKPDYIKIWDARTGRLERRVPGHRDAVLSLVYSKNGQSLLSGSYDKTARIWDVATSSELRVLGGHEWWVCSAAFSPDEKRVVTACQDGSVMIWDDLDLADRRLRQLAPTLTFLGHSGPVHTAAFSPGGDWIASAGYDKRVYLWKPVPDAKDSSLKTRYDAVLDGHTAPVHALQFSADGELLVTAGHDNTVRLWDVANRKLKDTLRGHSGPVRAVAMIPFPRLQAQEQAPLVKSQLISGGHDGRVKIWDIQGYREELVLGADIVRAHKDSVLGASFSPDGHSILSASRDRTARLWNRNNGKRLGEFQQGHHYLATTALFFPDGNRFITVAVDNSARIWDVATGLQIQSMEGTGLSAAAAIAPDGQRIATGSDKGTARIWDAHGNRLAETPNHQADVTAVAFSPDGRLLFTGDELGHCRLWDASTLKLLWDVHKHSRGVTSACFLPDGKRILTASTDHTVAQWDTEDGKENPKLTLGHAGAVTSLVLAPDGRRALATGDDGRARLWDVDEARNLGELGVAGETISAVAFSPDGLTAVATSTKAIQATASSTGGSQAKATAGIAESWIRLWDLKTLAQLPGEGGPSTPILTFREPSAMAWETIFSRDGASLLTVIGNEARMYNIKSRQESMAFIPQGAVASARFSPDGTRVVTGSWDNTARIWSIDGALAEVKLVGHEKYVNDAAFSPDGHYVATAGRDNQAILWDANTGAMIARFAGRKDVPCSVSSVAFDAPGRRLVTALQDHTARIWDVGTQKVLVTLGGPRMAAETPAQGGETPHVRPHTQAVLCAIFSLDGKHVLTGGEDNRAILWDATSGTPLIELQGHTAAVTSVAISSDGKRAVTGSRDSTAKLWELEEGKELLTLKGHSQDVTTVAFSNDGHSLLTGSLDGTMIVWPTLEWETKSAKTESVSLSDEN